MTDIVVEVERPRNAWRAEATASLKLAWPLVLANLAYMGMATTDVIMMGWQGPATLAAGALGTNLFMAFNIFAVGLVTATAPMIARERGRMRHSVRDVRRTVRQGLWIAFVIVLPVWSILWFAEPILTGLGQNPALAHEAGRYLHALQWSLLPGLGFIVLRAFVSAQERPLPALAVSFFAIVVNAIVVYTLMFGQFGFPLLGLLGAGIGTTIASFVMFLGLAAVVVIDRRFRRYHLFGRWWRPDWPRFVALWRLGLPIAIIFALEVVVFNLSALLVGLFGTEPLAAHHIALQIASLSFMVPMGLAQAATVRVGLAHGARDREGVRMAGWSAFALAILFMATMAVILLFFPRLLLSAFLDLSAPENRNVVAFAITFLAFAGLFQVFDGAQSVTAGMLRGLSDTRVPMVFAAIGYWAVGLPFGVLLGFVLGLQGAGIWAGLATGLALVAVLMTWRWINRERLGLLWPRGQSG